MMCTTNSLTMLLPGHKDGCIVAGATFMGSGTHLLVQTTICASLGALNISPRTQNRTEFK